MDDGAIRRADGDDHAIRDLLSDAWRAKWVVIGITALCAILGGASGFFLTKQYRAEVLISAVTDSPTGAGVGALVSQYGELASLAGVSLSGHGGNNKDESIAVLQSELITEAYIRANNLLPVLFAASWNADSKTWKSNDPKKIPTLWMGNQAFKKIREVKQDRQSGLVTLRITWRDPVTAAKWANDLVRETNQFLRDKAIRESERNIAYLNEEAAKTTVVEARQAMYSILKEEVNKEMIAKGRDEYALKVLDPARIPERSSTPSTLFLTALGFAAGLVLSALYVFSTRPARQAHAAS